MRRMLALYESIVVRRCDDPPQNQDNALRQKSRGLGMLAMPVTHS
jgi:hypothetical protein